MKKTVRSIFGAVACLALLGTAVSCNHDIDADDPFVTPSNNNQNENGNGNGDNETATELLTETFDLQKWNATKAFDKENFATAKAGDKLTFTYEHYDSDDADQYGICQFWSGEISDARKAEHMFAEVSDCSTTGTKSVVLKEADAAALKEEGLTIQGHELKISSMKFVSVGGASASEQEPTEDPAEEPAADYGLLDEAFNTLGWGTAVRIDAAKFANAAAGSKIIVTYEMNEDGQAGYHMFQLWNTAVDTDHVQFKEVAGLTEAGTYTHTLTADEAALVKANGLAIQGNSVTITKVELEAGEAPADEPAEAPAADTTIWTGSTDLAWGARAPEVALADKDFTGLKITYTTTADAGLCFKLLDTSWGAFELTSVTGDGTLRAADASDDPLKAVDLTSGKTDGVVTVTFADVTAVKTGLGFQGAPGVTITKIELVTE